jgi:repressor LexA
MQFSNNLRYLRRQNRQSQQELAALLDYRSFTTIQKWETGSSMPPLDILNRLAVIYQLSVDQLINSDLTRQAVPIPVLGKVKAGIPIEAVENIIGYENINYEEQQDGRYFYLQVVGDSMKNLRIMEGDLVYIRQQNYLEDYAIGVIMIDGEATLKRIHYVDEQIHLLSENENYPPIICNPKEQNIQIIGQLIHNKIKY